MTDSPLARAVRRVYDQCASQADRQRIDDLHGGRTAERACAIRRLMNPDTDLRARFDAEVRVAGLQLGERDYELLFSMWAEHLPQREALRATVPGPDEEPLG
jgi:hypothetical protein